MLTLDLFFNYRLIKKYLASSEIYVFPDMRLIENFGIELMRITGEAITRRHYVEDQFQLRSIRDYHPFDSFKNVNWSATAKTGEIKVNQKIAQLRRKSTSCLISTRSATGSVSRPKRM